MTTRHAGMSVLGRAARPQLLAAAAGIAFIMAPQAALAQSTAPADDAEADEGQIIVLARKQAETLQEVPVTITSVGTDTIQDYNLTDTSAVTSRVPTLNVQVGGSGSGGQISLRGVGSSNISASFDSAVAFDYDGVQVSTMRLVQAAFVDTAQIDVLKGPQSLFFGKSASAGVLSIRSLDPTPDWEIGGKASYEFEEKGWLIGGYISGPLTPTLGIRLAAEHNDIKEFVKLQPGTPAVNQVRGLKNTLGRMTLNWEPVSGFTANLKVQYSHQTNDGAIGQSDLFCGANGKADPVVLFQGAITIPAGYDCNFKDGKYFLPDTAPALAKSVPTATGPTKALGYGGVPFGETDIWFGRLKLDFEFTPNFTFSSVTGYVNLDSTDVDNYSYGGVGKAFLTAIGSANAVSDAALAANFPALAAANAAGTPLGVGTSDPRNALKQFSQEVRLTSDLDGPFNFMVGGYYEWRKFIFDTAQNAVNISLIAPDPTIPLASGGVAPGTGFTFDYDKNHTTKTDAGSVFASAIVNLTDQLELSGGVRYTKENKTQFISVPYVHNLLAYVQNPVTKLFSPSPAFIRGGFKSGPIRFKDSQWSPEATIKYEINPDVNVFASYKTGFKSGGIDNSALPSNSLSQAALTGDFSGLIYKSETAKGFEVGIKSQLANRDVTLNATLFSYKFRNLQVQVFNAVAVQFVTTNAGDVTTKGLDLSFNWRTPVEGLSVSSNLAYLDAEFSSDYVTFLGANLKGRDTSRAPKWSGNLAFDWKVPIGDAMQFHIGGNANYSDKYFTTTTSFTDFVQPSFVTFDATAAIGHPDGLWKLALIGNNLTDKLIVMSSGGRPFLSATGDDVIVSQNRGRQVFVQGTFKF